MNTHTQFWKSLSFLIFFTVTPFIVMAGGAQEDAPPTLDIPAQPRQYISPANGDDVQDILQLSFSSIVAPAEGAVIVEYNLSIYDADGKLVSLTREVESGRRGFFGNLFGGEKPRVAIPDTLVWNGTWNVPDNELPEGVSNGDYVEDGEYTYQLTVIDDQNRFNRSAPFAVTVDNTPPQIGDHAMPDYTIFSPNNDGVRDNISIPLAGSRELKWTVEVSDESDTTVFTQIYENDNPRRRDLDPAPPETFVWDGQTGSPDDLGPVAPEGSYYVVLTGTDRAGNSAQGQHPAEITLDLSAAELAVRPADGNPSFSPNGDGRRDTIDLDIVSTQDEMVRSWRLEVFNARQVVRTYRGSGSPPGRVTFDGMREDGSRLGDGALQVRIIAEMINGNTVTSDSLSLVIDTVPPALSVSAKTAPQPTAGERPLIFGAGDKRRLEASISLETAADWHYEINHNGVPFMSGMLRDVIGAIDLPLTEENGRTSVSLAWSGEALDTSGPAMDGLYELILVGTDAAGNRRESQPFRVVKDTRQPGTRLALDGEHLSPLSSGGFSAVTFRIEYGAPDIIDEFLFEVVNDDGQMVRSSYQRRPFDTFRWNGLTNGGTVTPDGDYYGRIRIVYLNGHVAESSNVGPVLVDRTAPRITRLVAEPRTFSPDGDGVADTVMIQQEVAPGDEWTGRILNEAGDVILERSYADTVQSFRWDGLDSEGTPLPDGDYKYILTSTDAAGNSTREELLIALNTTPIAVPPPEMRLGVRPNPFTPNGDGVDDTAVISASIQAEAEIVAWEARITDDTDTIVRTFDGTGRPPLQIRWDGRDADGNDLSEGEYRYTMVVTDEADNTTQEELLITLRKIPEEMPAPEMRLSVRPNPFSPDGDGVDETVTVSVSIEAETEIVSWNARILDHTGRVFKTFRGTGRPPRLIRWDGLSNSGTLVDSALDYPFEITIRDDQDNVVTESVTIATDILVIREGENRLRIRVSSIHFAGNTADLFAGTDEELARNLDTLRRLARILNKYPEREIIVEGHAAHIYLEGAAMRAEQEQVLIPLSRARATEVMQALIILGVDRNRMRVEAYGGSRPVVPHADRPNMWQNRRVEFLLNRQTGR